MVFTVRGKLPYLDQVGKILPFDVIVSLQVDFPKLICSYWIVLGVEFVKAMKGLSTL